MLGGKSPNIVFADCEMDEAIKGAYNGIYMNSGQVCQAGTRLMVQRDVKDEFVARLIEMSRAVRGGSKYQGSSDKMKTDPASLSSHGQPSGPSRDTWHLELVTWSLVPAGP